MNTSPSDVATPVVSAFYDRFPYPGDPLQDGPPPGYNWRWCHDSVLAVVRGGLQSQDSSLGSIRILDAGCGTGVSTDYLCHLNPGAEVLAVDISAGALDVARERLRRSGGAEQVRSLRQEQRSLLDLEDEGCFDYINSVGVLHHLRDPLAGLKALGQRLAPQGLLHLFLYADAGRWEIHRTQQALKLLEAGIGADGLRLGRELLSDLPETNRLRRTHEQRWALDTHADANFADMYLHPQETSYDLERLMALIKSSGLYFAGFSNPSVWDPARLLKGELLSRAQSLPPSDQWALVEQLDPDISHFEFFVSAQPVHPLRWENDETLLQACGRRQSCLWGWPSKSMLGPDLEPISISDEELSLLRLVDEKPGVPLGTLSGDNTIASLARELMSKKLLLLEADHALFSGIA
ncbi:phycobiliprotein asparagine methyltransferase [Synechococcus sp. PROS-9-1]|uniref:class I SAM-dependent methyltransferase n=1 Tax=Synechococcus sp. PROS-9-1 TaxID=1968775 RepID=UPI00164406FE|nr:class I SAM-dependent methyltransferase [Synechococcus sp. PROS-9-1]QNJ32604.1 phycobiliprotein asparagine methyltransferase [Synechococcus sp. PROS-9-1]